MKPDVCHHTANARRRVKPTRQHTTKQHTRGGSEGKSQLNDNAPAHRNAVSLPKRRGVLPRDPRRRSPARATPRATPCGRGRAQRGDARCVGMTVKSLSGVALRRRSRPTAARGALLRHGHQRMPRARPTLKHKRESKWCFGPIPRAMMSSEACDRYGGRYGGRLRRNPVTYPRASRGQLAARSHTCLCPCTPCNHLQKKTITIDTAVLENLAKRLRDVRGSLKESAKVERHDGSRSGSGTAIMTPVSQIREINCYYHLLL